MFNSAPPLPPRTSSHVIQSKVTFKGISIICLCVYYWRDRAVYEELVDYLDKTISISKINYNHLLGLYQLNDKEIEALSEQRTLLERLFMQIWARIQYTLSTRIDALKRIC
ncbi:hypothetical protein Y032_0403g816 [Ancylostoma ceylanicum]|uniref:Uncharacterized protein n=1 Tax=Ancylostoma ceylanicum TaxID=53326 RepID=A0A016X2D0_9BILA|nr:hypothetical protein Y032_0403g816 [Ancylostoma ceylanicum]